MEHEQLGEDAIGYTARAKDGADRLRKILTAMSEASRVEELMKDAEPEHFDLRTVIEATVSAYRDVYTDRTFMFDCADREFPASGSPELLIQMLDKLVDNAVSFSAEGDEVAIRLSADDGSSRTRSSPKSRSICRASRRERATRARSSKV